MNQQNEMNRTTYTIQSLEELESLAGQLAGELRPGLWVELRGQLGAGKTTLVRALLRRLGFEGPVNSPTYPIVLEYEVNDMRIIHMDGFRLDPHSIEPWDYQEWRDAIVMVEWADRTRIPKDRFQWTISIELDEGTQSRKIHVDRLAPSQYE